MGQSAREDASVERLTALLEALASLARADDVCRAVALGVLSGEQVRAVTLSMVGGDGGALRVIGTYGLDTRTGRELTRRDRAPRTPEHECVLQGRVVTVAREDLERTFPLADWGRVVSDWRWAVHAPLRDRGVPIGALSVAYAGEGELGMPTLQRSMEAAVALWAARYRRELAGRDADRPALTQRQRLVVQLAAEGHTNSSIARQLGYSERTIKADLTALYVLLGAHGRADLVARAHDAGIVVTGTTESRSTER